MQVGVGSGVGSGVQAPGWFRHQLWGWLRRPFRCRRFWSQQLWCSVRHQLWSWFWCWFRSGFWCQLGCRFRSSQALVSVLESGLELALEFILVLVRQWVLSDHIILCVACINKHSSYWSICFALPQSSCNGILGSLHSIFFLLLSSSSPPSPPFLWPGFPPSSMEGSKIQWAENPTNQIAPLRLTSIFLIMDDSTSILLTIQKLRVKLTSISGDKSQRDVMA